ncbi:GDSL-type esterase/lipase family protein [Xanthomonas sp. XNM01]|uniref:GDSL-type esterase/lipase family protein n=1 Tax=Xanthomonas sp. XNM01 TaxID=2769289 RepID=UPI00177FF449|nr:GDSL-type esterase/lipase family protein [Xanthomonas sp. XNM01]MBD9368521.1 hypothetical protein [Xanthomonas sp. XNM01]
MAIGKNNLTLAEFDKAQRRHPQAPRALCFGDSWFQYPPHPTDLNKQLARMFKDTLFLREGVAGRDSAMWKRALPRVQDEIGTYRFDAILLSAGGNDVVGSELGEFVKKPTQPQSPGDVPWGEIPAPVFEHIRLDTFGHALRYAISDIRQVIQIRDLHSPQSLIHVHTYDYVWPWDSPFRLGPLRFGPWIKPWLDAAGLVAPDAQQVVTHWLIDQFARELKALVSQHPNMVLIDSRGTLRTRAQWNDEIHPSAAGFERIARQCWKPRLTGVLR